MNTADLITSFFNNEMSPDQERQFLLSVASSDSLRLGVKSHAMLDKILYEQSSKSRVPAEIRMNIMREAAVVAAAASSALAPQDALAKNSGSASATAPTSASETSATGTGSSYLAGGRGAFRWSSATLALLLGIGGFFAGFYTGTESAGNQVANSVQLSPTSEQSRGVSPGVSGTSVQVPASSVAGTTSENEAARQSSASGRVEGERTRQIAIAPVVDTRRTEPSASGRTGSAGNSGAGRTGQNTLSGTSAQNAAAASTSTKQGSDVGNDPFMAVGQLEVINTSDSAHK